jgi:glycosyltransferase involved in cell wall biosynthesis
VPLTKRLTSGVRHTKITQFQTQGTVSIAIPQLTGGGAEKVTRRLASRLHGEGRLSRLYTGSTRGAELLPPLPLRNLEAPRALQAVLRFARAVADDPADAFLLTLGYVNLAMLVRLRRPKARIVLRIGNTVTPELRTLSATARLRYMWSLRLAAHTADLIIVQCRDMGQDLVRHMPKLGDKLRVVYNFVEDELWRWRAPAEPPLASPYVFCAANMKPQKGFDVLLAAYARSTRRRPAGLVVAGVDPANEPFSQLMRANDLKESEVLRLGFLPDPYGWMAHAELCVLASRFEGFSNFLLEAAALGKRIVATDCPGGNAELFEHYPNVEAVPVDDVAALARALAMPRRDLDRDRARNYLQPFEQNTIYARYTEILSGQGDGARTLSPGAA